MSGIGTKDGRVRALVEDLMPGVKYQFDIHTVSYSLHSYTTTLAARTSKLFWRTKNPKNLHYSIM